MADFAVRLEGLERWRDGNGKPGAAAILADHEKRITKNEEAIEGQGKEITQITFGCALEKATAEQVIEKAVSAAMRKRGRSIEGIVRAFGPYAAAIASVAVAIIATGG